MDRPPFQGHYEPLPRHGHGVVKFGDKVYMWGGKNKSWNTYPATDIEIFDICTGLWEKKTCSGTPPPGTVYSGYTRIGGMVYSFGGWKDDARYNSLHLLDLSNLMWEELKPNDSADGPSGREGCGMVSLGLEMLVIFGGSTGDSQYTNDLHLYSLIEGTWSCPFISGASPEPRAWFSFTKIDASRAAIFGGWVEGHSAENDLYILNMKEWHWSQVVTRLTTGISCPPRRCFHSACGIGGPLMGVPFPQLLIMGGLDHNMSVLDDAWILDLNPQSPTWLQVKSIGGNVRRRAHTATVINFSPKVVQVMMFGGQRSGHGTQLAATTVLQICMPLTPPISLQTSQPSSLQQPPCFYPTIQHHSTEVRSSDRRVPSMVAFYTHQQYPLPPVYQLQPCTTSVPRCPLESAASLKPRTGNYEEFGTSFRPHRAHSSYKSEQSIL